MPTQGYSAIAVDSSIPKLDLEIVAVKEELAALAKLKHDKKQAKKEVEILSRFKGLANQRSEALLKLQKAYKIKVEGDRVPELQDCFSKLKAKYSLSASFMAKITKAGF